MTYRTMLVIETAEPVTPAYLAQRVAEACAAYGALRPGEAVTVPKVLLHGNPTRYDETRFVVTHTPRPSPFEAPQ